MTDKPIFTPSAIKDYETCKFAYLLLWERYLDFPTRIDPRPTLGTFGHAMHAAHELGNDEQKALAREIKKLKTASGYSVKDFQILAQLERESKKIFAGGSVTDGKGKVTKFEGYGSYRENMTIQVRGTAEQLETVDVEKRLFVDLGPIVAAPKLDLVLLSESGEMWVAEHKFTERDDAGWANRWLMDGQTTLQVMAAEKHYDREVKGLLLLAVLLGRQRAPKGASSSSIVGRKIIRVVRPEPRWVSKNSPELRANYTGRLEDLAHDYKERLGSNRWPTTGMDTRTCDRCQFRGICSGQDSARRLIPKVYRDLEGIRKKGKAT